MVNMEFTITNIVQFFGFLTPLLIGFFLLGASVINKNIKGLIYIAGVMFAFILNTVFKNVIRSEQLIGRSQTCDLIGLPFGTAYNVPSWNSVFIAFTFAYLCLPMAFTKNWNFGVVISLIVLFCIEAVTGFSNRCTNSMGIVIGGLFGLILGGIWFAIIRSSGNTQLLYFEEMTNGETCSRPSKQKFKCSVYKNGKLIKNL